MKTPLWLFACMIWSAIGEREQKLPPRYEPVPDAAIVRQQPYHRFFTQDAFHRRIVFYLSDEPEGTEPLPLVVYVHGSGGQSHFAEVNGRVEGRNGHSSIADAIKGRAHLLIVEKPGVNFLDAPSDAGGAARASEEFRAEHTLDRWTEAVRAAVEAARKLAQIRAGSILVIGHSEGGIVAAKLAADHRWITHVAVLAGGGPSQLFDLLTLARQGEFFQHISEDPDKREDYVLEQWRAIQADPQNSEKLFFGHPYRRWSSFLKTSTLEQLRKTDAKIYAAQGTQDRAVAWESFEFLRSELLAHGKDVTFDPIAGADHSFALSSSGPTSDGWTALFQRILLWFLDR